MKVQHVRAKVAALVVFGLLSLGIFLYLFAKAGGQLRLSEPYRASVLVPEAFQLVKNSDVRTSGVKIGRVTAITDVGTTAKVTVELEAAHAPLRRDSEVMVRTKTLVGENYLEIIPGSPAAPRVASGGTVSLKQAREAVPIDKVLATFDAPTRRRVTRNLRALGSAVDGRGRDLNAALASLRPLTQNGEKVMAVLAAQRDRVASLVDGAGEVMAAVGDRDRHLRSLVVDARRTAVAVSERDRALGETLEQLPGTLRQARTSLTTLSTFSRRATPVVASLRRGATALQPAARDLAPAAADAREITRTLRPTLDRVDALLPAFRKLAREVPGATTGLRALLAQANPFVDYVEPYTADAMSFLGNMGSVFTTDELGYVGHVKALLGATTLKVFSPAEKKALEALVYTGAAGLLHEEKINPFPRPGTSGDPQEWDGTYPEIKARP